MRTLVLFCALVLSALHGCTHAERSDAGTHTSATPTHPELRVLLRDLFDRDQAARAALIEVWGVAERGEDGRFVFTDKQREVVDTFAAIDRESTAFMKSVIDEHGFPTIDMVGRDGAEAAWLLVMHADKDPAFQRRAMALMEPLVESGQCDAWRYAQLTDRVLRAQGKPQRYATQFERDRSGMIRPLPVEEPERVDELRAAVGLPPLAEKAAQLAEEYGMPVSPIPMSADEMRADDDD